MSVFTPSWVPWEGWGHLLFWLLLAALVEVVVHNLNRWRRGR